MHGVPADDLLECPLQPSSSSCLKKFLAQGILTLLLLFLLSGVSTIVGLILSVILTIILFASLLLFLLLYLWLLSRGIPLSGSYGIPSLLLLVLLLFLLFILIANS
jgi:hypothetical protein